MGSDFSCTALQLSTGPDLGHSRNPQRLSLDSLGFRVGSTGLFSLGTDVRIERHG